MKKTRIALFGLAIAAMSVSTATVASATPPPDHKIGICHRTGSDTNPYVFIEVDKASEVPGHLGNSDPGHKPTYWKSAGLFGGTLHMAGDPKDDFLAESAEDCGSGGYGDGY